MAASDGKGTVWFTESTGRGPSNGTEYEEVSSIGKIDVATGEVTEYDLKTRNVSPYYIQVAPDGKVWFTAHPGILGSIDSATGKMEEIPVPAVGGQPVNQAHSYATTMLVGQNGLIRLCARGTSSIDSYDPKTRQFKIYPVGDAKAPGDFPFGIAEHGDKIWFGMDRENKIGSVDVSTGEVKKYAFPTPKVGFERVKVDQKGRVWIPERDVDKLGLLEPGSEQIVEFDLPYKCYPYTLEVDRDGAIWTACQKRSSLVRTDPDTKVMVEYPQPSGSGGVIRELTLDPRGDLWYADWLDAKITGVRQIHSAVERRK